jgi:hypothetical protein
MTAAQELPAFIRQHFRSVWALEILLILRKEPVRSWDADEIVRELRASRPLVVSNLEAFERSGFVLRGEDGRHSFAPASLVIAQMCDVLEAAYRERPVAVINLISAPEERLKQLADAFRFKDRLR